MTVRNGKIIGSSPRVWGQVSQTATADSCLRIIPTRMGTSSAETADDVVSQGSSPRVWGQDVRNCQFTVIVRIIPTRMGTSFAFCKLPNILGDHPHAYGDKSYGGKVADFKGGSSPRVWGQACFPCAELRFPGIIPTRMGTRLLADPLLEQVTDHPHAYGDKKFAVSVTDFYKGSSPRVWGQVISSKFKRETHRIIPTRMGTSK